MTAFMTAFYTFRAFFMTFCGPEKLPEPRRPGGTRDAGSRRTRRRPRPTITAHGRCATARSRRHIGHESPPVMTIPLIALAGCTVLIGLVCLVFGPFCGAPVFAHHLHPTLGFESLGHFEHALRLGDGDRGHAGRHRWASL